MEPGQYSAQRIDIVELDGIKDHFATLGKERILEENESLHDICAIVFFAENLHLDSRNNNYIKELEEVGEIFYILHDEQNLLEFIKTSNKLQYFMIVLNNTRENILQEMEKIPLVESIFIFEHVTCEDRLRNLFLRKIRGPFSDFHCLLANMKESMREYSRRSISFVATSVDHRNELEPTFMYTSLLKEIILELNYDMEDLSGIREICMQKLGTNNREAVDSVMKVLNWYKSKKKKAIFCYTKESPFYRILNRALYEFDIETILKMGKFIKDLHGELYGLHAEQRESFPDMRVYRGEVMSRKRFKQINDSKGGFLSFDNFLSTTSCVETAKKFSQKFKNEQNMERVLFEADINWENNTAIFADVAGSSSVRHENEILFSTNTVFLIKDIIQKDVNTTHHRVLLELVEPNDSRLVELMDEIKRDISHREPKQKLAKLMLIVGKYDRARQLYAELLTSVGSGDVSEEAFLQHQYAYATFMLGDYTHALEKYMISRRKYVNIPGLNTMYFATISNNIGLVHLLNEEAEIAIGYFKEAREIYEKMATECIELATIYSNMGRANCNLKKYELSREHYNKALKLTSKLRPQDHPDVAASYNDMGHVLLSMGDNAEALKNYEKSYDIYTRCLPSIHPSIATNYNDRGLVYSNMGKHEESVSFHKKAVDIYTECLPKDHSSLAMSYNNLAISFSLCGNYLDAEKYFLKALGIWENKKVEAMGSLNFCYKNIANVYAKLKKHEKAIDYYKKTLYNHSNDSASDASALVDVYYAMGNVYSDLGDNAEAIKYYEMYENTIERLLPENDAKQKRRSPTTEQPSKSRGIQQLTPVRQKTLDLFDHDVSMLPINVAEVYAGNGEYEKAIEKYERLINNSNSSSYDNQAAVKIYLGAGSVNMHMGNSTVAEKYYRKALQLQETVPHSSNLTIAITYKKIGDIYAEKLAYEDALQYYKKSRYIFDSCIAQQATLAASSRDIHGMQQKLGDNDDTLDNYRKFIVMIEAMSTYKDSDLISIFNDMAQLFKYTGDYVKAIESYRKICAINERFKRISDLDMGNYHRYIGLLYSELANKHEALKSFSMALKYYMKLPDNKQTYLGICYGNIASVYSHLGQNKKGLVYLQKSIESNNDFENENISQAIQEMQSILCEEETDEYPKEILQHFQIIISEFESHVHYQDMVHATKYINMGNACADFGHYNKALQFLRKAETIFKQLLTEQHQNYAIILDYLGSAHSNLGEFQQALGYYNRSLEIRQRILPENHPELAATYRYIGDLYLEMRDIQNAKKYLEESIKISGTINKADHPSLAIIYRSMGNLKRAMGQFKEAHDYLEKTKLIQESIIYCHPKSFALTLNYLGELYRDMGQHERAIEMHQEAEKTLRKILIEDHPDLAPVYFNFARVYRLVGNVTNARDYADRAIRILDSKIPDHPRLIEYREFLGQINA